MPEMKNNYVSARSRRLIPNKPSPAAYPRDRRDGYSEALLQVLTEEGVADLATRDVALAICVVALRLARRQEIERLRRLR